MTAKNPVLDHPDYQYIKEISPNTEEIIQTAIKYSITKTKLTMHTAIEQLQFYNWLIHTKSIKRILEIGTFTGIGTLSMALSLPEEGTITTLDHSYEFTTIAQEIWGESDCKNKIDLIVANASQTLEQLIRDERTFDLVIIDANKRSIQEYYEYALQLSNSTGIIVIDNTLFNGLARQASAYSLPEPQNSHQRNLHKYAKSINQFNQKLKLDKRVKISCIPLGDGCTVATKCSPK